MAGAIVLMVLLGLLDVLKGLDFEETVLSWGAAGVLLACGRAFTVRHDPITLRSAAWRAPALGAFGLSLVAVAAWASRPPVLELRWCASRATGCCGRPLR